jgi:hypothetical protein
VIAEMFSIFGAIRPTVYVGFDLRRAGEMLNLLQPRV